MNVNASLINQIKSCLKEYTNVRCAKLFGSRARGDNTESSDYDIAIYGELSAREAATLRYMFNEELPTLHKIDLVFMCEQQESEFTACIEREGIVIYGKN